MICKLYSRSCNWQDATDKPVVVDPGLNCVEKEVFSEVLGQAYNYSDYVVADQLNYMTCFHALQV